jgi:hypothetical protein
MQLERVGIHHTARVLQIDADQAAVFVACEVAVDANYTSGIAPLSPP